MSKTEKIIITGANGFIGSHIVRKFLDEKLTVDCLVRKSSDLSNLSNLNINLIYGDIRNKNELVKAFSGKDLVIHTAALVRDWGEYKDFYDINVTGVLNTLIACLEVGIKNVIITGSNSVYGEENCELTKDETFPFNSHYKYFLDKIFPCKLNYYRDTKAIGTQKSIEFAKKHNLNLTILEPVWVFGEREFNTGFFDYLKTAKSGIPLLPGSTKNLFHVIYAGDLANSFFLAWKKKLTGVNRFIIANDKPESMEKIYSLFCKSAKIKKPANLLKWMIYPVGFIMELFSTLFRTKNPPLLTRGRINMFYDTIKFSAKKARRELGFSQQYTLEQSITKTVQWYIDNNFFNNVHKAG